jgi:hypothetical protein
MATLRGQLLKIRGGELRLAALDTGLAMEIEHYTAGRDLIGRLQAASRREHLQWLKSSSFFRFDLFLKAFRPAVTNT